MYTVHTVWGGTPLPIYLSTFGQMGIVSMGIGHCYFCIVEEMDLLILRFSEFNMVDTDHTIRHLSNPAVGVLPRRDLSL